MFNGAMLKHSSSSLAQRSAIAKAAVWLLSCSGKFAFFTDRIDRPTSTKVQWRAFASGWSSTELNHEPDDG